MIRFLSGGRPMACPSFLPEALNLEGTLPWQRHFHLRFTWLLPLLISFGILAHSISSAPGETPLRSQTAPSCHLPPPPMMHPSCHTSCLTPSLLTESLHHLPPTTSMCHLHPCSLLLLLGGSQGKAMSARKTPNAESPALRGT